MLGSLENQTLRKAKNLVAPSLFTSAEVFENKREKGANRSAAALDSPGKTCGGGAGTADHAPKATRQLHCCSAPSDVARPSGFHHKDGFIAFAGRRTSELESEAWEQISRNTLREWHDKSQESCAAKY